MGSFEEAFNKTMGHEGGYSNDPDDAGGETYRGISRRYHPSWEGWKIIDEAKRRPNWRMAILDSLQEGEELDAMTRAFYKQHYWDVNRLDWVPQTVAEEMFDTGVNLGVGRAAEFLQRALNYLNRNGRLFCDLVDDGNIGPITLSALSTLVAAAHSDVSVLLKIMNVLQGAHYLEYMTKSPTQEKYARGWFARVEFSRAVPPAVSCTAREAADNSTLNRNYSSGSVSL